MFRICVSDRAVSKIYKALISSRGNSGIQRPTINVVYDEICLWEVISGKFLYYRGNITFNKRKPLSAQMLNKNKLWREITPINICCHSYAGIVSNYASCYLVSAGTFLSQIGTWRALTSRIWRQVVRQKFTQTSEVNIVSSLTFLCLLFGHEDGGSTSVRNVDKTLPHYALYRHRRWKSS
jgi:hypothetical protein